MITDRGRRVLRIEADAIVALIPKVDEQFDRAVEILRDCRGRVVLTGMGKSGSIAQKIASTMASTGTPAFFLHPTEGGHGDLGMLVRGDVLIAVSNSGETDELIELLPAIKRLGLKLIALVGDPSSTLARQSDVAIDVSVPEEACPMGLAPTASTTAALAMGDALAGSPLGGNGGEGPEKPLPRGLPPPARPPRRAGGGGSPRGLAGGGAGLPRAASPR